MSSLHSKSRKFNYSRMIFTPGGEVDSGQLRFDQLCYYDIETDTSTIDVTFPDVTDDMTASQIDAMIDEFIKNHALNVRNLVQVAILVPAAAKGLKNAITVCRSVDSITLNDVEFVRCIIGSMKNGRSRAEKDAHAKDVAQRFLAFRMSLKSHKIFVGFNNLRFDSGAVAKLCGITDICESLTHKLTINTSKYKLHEFDVLKWSMALGFSSLRKLGAGLTKMGYDSEKYDDLVTDDQDKFDQYNLRDCEIVANLVHLLNSLGIFHHNMPSFVRNYYSQSFKKQGFESVHSDPSFQSYAGLGARCEAYEFKLNDARVYDFNSLYPSVQTLLPFPAIKHHKNEKSVGVIKLSTVSLASKQVKELPLKIQQLDDHAGACVVTDRKFLDAYESIFGKVFYWLKVKIHAVDPRFAHIFPFGYKDENELVRFTLNEDVTYEIDSYNIAFLAHCSYTIVHARVTQYENLIFADEARELYQKRKEYKKQGSPLQMLNKIILNSGFGIWGSRGDKSTRDNSKTTRENFERLRLAGQKMGVRVKDVVMYDTQMQSYARVRNIGERLYKVDQELPRFTKRSIPGISQTTLSHARALMYSVMRAVIYGGGKIFYTDTDSLFLDERGEKIVHALGLVGDDLGQCKLEYKIYKGFAMGSKLYNIVTQENEYKVTAKGVKNVGKVNTNFSTSTVDELKAVRKVVAAAGGITKRRLDLESGKHVNEYGERNKAWGQALVKMLELHSQMTNERIDDEVIAGFLEL